MVSIVGRAGSRPSRSIFVLVLSGSTFGLPGSSHSSSTFGFFKIFWVGWNVLLEDGVVPEKGQPGYGLHDRALGAMYLHGLWEGIVGESAKR